MHGYSRTCNVENRTVTVSGSDIPAFWNRACRFTRLARWSCSTSLLQHDALALRTVKIPRGVDDNSRQCWSSSKYCCGSVNTRWLGTCWQRLVLLLLLAGVAGMSSSALQEDEEASPQGLGWLLLLLFLLLLLTLSAAEEEVTSSGCSEEDSVRPLLPQSDDSSSGGREEEVASSGSTSGSSCCLSNATMIPNIQSRGTTRRY